MAVATGVHHRTYGSEVRLRTTRAEQARLGLALAALVVAPFLLSNFWMTVAIQVGIAVVGAVGLNILTGFTGQISLGQGGFLAVGAYASALLVTRAGLPTVVAIIAAVAVTALVGALFGLPALRLKGLYLAIATLAAQQIILWLVRNWTALTGGNSSIFVDFPTLGGFAIDTDFKWYWVVLVAAALATITGRNLFRVGIGRAFMAIRDQDIAAEAIGVNLTRFKVLAFALSSAYVGLAGALTAHWTQIVTWERFTLDVSVLYLAMIIVGGMSSILGSILGAAFMIIVPSLLKQGAQGLDGSFLATQLPAIELFTFGLVIVVFLIFEPRGLARMWQRTKDYFRLWPFRY